MRGDGCFIIGRAANIKSDFYCAGDKDNPEPKYVPAPEDIRYEIERRMKRRSREGSSR